MISLFIALPLGFHLGGLQGATWGIVFSYFSSLPLIVFYAAPLGLFNIRKELIALSILIIGVITGEALNATITFITHAQKGS
jgi:hypothetical protein